MKSYLSQKILKGIPLETIESTNSFLVETSYNSDIDMDIRMEIESKFHQSQANLHYKFPRTTKNQKQVPKLNSTNSFESTSKQKLIHRSTKSTLYPYQESKVPELFTSRNPKTSTNLHKSPKNKAKNGSIHIRVYSNRTLNKNSSPDSKSPAQKKSFVGIYSKVPTQLMNPSINEILNKVSSCNIRKNFIVRTESMRLSRVYRNLKTKSKN